MILNRLSLLPIFVIALIYPVLGQETKNDSEKLNGPYLGQNPPGLTPTVFAPGIVSTEDHKELGGGAFSPDGREYYFTRSVNDRWAIFVTRLENDVWTIPESGRFSEGYTALEPHIPFDYSRIFWVSWGWKQAGTYMAIRTSDGWSEASYVGSGMVVSSSRDGQMYVTDMRVKPNQIVNVDIADGRFKEYRSLKGKIAEFQKRNRTAHPCIAPDGSYLIFDNDATSLSVSFRERDNEWGAPIDLTKHGFDPKAGIASVTPDGKYIFFGLNGDIYWVSSQIIEQIREDRSK